MADPPLIDTQTLATSTDQQVAIQVVKRMREMWATKSYSAITTSANEIMPGPNVQSDDEILQYLLANAGSGFHCACTCELDDIIDDYGNGMLIPHCRQNGERPGCECSRHNDRQS
jgi:choline dehydrogenase